MTAIPESTTPEIITPSDIVPSEETYPWLAMQDEPSSWYKRFATYFLPQGPGRSLLQAFILMLNTEHPDVAAARKLKNKVEHAAADHWHKASRKWNWVARARAYDRFTYSRATAVVEVARLTILENANNAANALVAALTNDRLKVAAAKEILDRAGLPGTTNIGLGPIEKFNADELHEAEKEVAEWETMMKPPSVENG